MFARNGIFALASAAALLLPVAASAEAKVFAYGHAANYCPAGLQPVTIDGTICCGTPNQSMTYQQAMAHPAPRKSHAQTIHRRAHVSQSHCPVGTKGCGFD
ncbi:hypothetical protein ABMC89_00700 [Sulfitobacter sp. HNIBRBA3233]|uniref:hypothetical protein n=1 Tax=Sulfitobacter marinivivus TaxID=3158558 RepID=UPI0032DEB5C2